MTTTSTMQRQRRRWLVVVTSVSLLLASVTLTASASPVEADAVLISANGAQAAAVVHHKQNNTNGSAPMIDEGDLPIFNHTAPSNSEVSSSETEIQEHRIERYLWRKRLPNHQSDWTFYIRRQQSSNDQQGNVRKVLVDKYELHKVKLQDIPRFNELWSTNVQEITMPVQAADAFPKFLDYIYSNGNTLRLPVPSLPAYATTATSLYHVAATFGSKPLEQRLQGLIREQLTVQRLQHYLPVIFQFRHHEPLVNMARFRLLQLFLAGGNVLVGPQAFKEILKHVPADMFHAVLKDWIDIVAKRQEYAAATSDSYVSCVVADYIVLHSQGDLQDTTRLTRNQFRHMTGAKVMPVVHADCAVKLIQLELDIFGHLYNEKVVSSLQRRALQALIEQPGHPTLPHLANMENHNTEHLVKLLTSGELPEPEERQLPDTSKGHRILMLGAQVNGLNGIYRPKTTKSTNEQYRYENSKGFTVTLQTDEDSGKTLWKIASPDATDYFKFQVGGTFFDHGFDTSQVDVTNVPPLFGWLASNPKSGAPPVLVFQPTI